MAAIVVGVSYVPGIGFAVAKRFAAGGLKVGIVGRQEARLQEAKAQILAAVPDASVEVATGDVTDAESIQGAIGRLVEAHGPATALVYNVSSRPMPTVNVGDADPVRLLDDYKTGPLGAVHCVQAVLPAMREAAAGSIIFTGATASLRGAPGFGPFSAAKAGLRHLAQALAKEEAGNGIHVAHVIVDGMVDVAGIRDWAPDVPEGRLIATDAIAEAYCNLHLQPKRCFTFEQDLRPFESKW